MVLHAQRAVGIHSALQGQQRYKREGLPRSRLRKAEREALQAE